MKDNILKDNNKKKNKKKNSRAIVYHNNNLKTAGGLTKNDLFKVAKYMRK